MLHEQLQRLEFVRPARLDTRLFRECLEIGVGNRLKVTKHVFDPNFYRLELLTLLRGNRGLHINIL